MIIRNSKCFGRPIIRCQWISIFVFLLTIAPYITWGQKIPHLTSDLVNEGLVPLNFKEAWLFHSGDSAAWASVNLDDSEWQNIYPIALKTYAMPDSLWPGYGWWRFKFTSDKQLANKIKRLYFSTWGAADVYLDGKLIHAYGHFSKTPDQEKINNPNYEPDKFMQLSGDGEHVLAIRFSNHYAKRNDQYLKHFSRNLGFFIGFATEVRGAYSDSRYSNSLATLSVIGVVLFILFILHILLYLKFNQDPSNLLISLITLLFFIAAVSAHILLFLNISSFWGAIFDGVINSVTFCLAFGLLPYTLALLFGLKKYQWVKHLVWLVAIRTLNYFIHFMSFLAFDASVILFIITLLIIIMIRAIKNKHHGVHFVTFGAIGTAIFLMINRLIDAGIFKVPTTLIYIDLILLYISFPLGIYIYITNQFGSLYKSMEKEVANRTNDLQISIENLQKTQKALAGKNQENELLLKEIHHRVKNNLEIVSGLLELQSSQIDDPAIQEAMILSQNRVHSMGIIHQKLYQGDQLASIEMRDYFANLANNILSSFDANHKVKITSEMPAYMLDVDTAISVGLIANELLTNALKYAFEGKDNGQIAISLHETEHEKLKLTIADNGIGKQKDMKPIGSGFGTMLIELLTKQLNGIIDYKVDRGTQVSLIFPKKNAVI